jgi:hypothetical protein
VTADYVSASHLLVFTPDGRFDRRLGGEGEGPGEFQFISAAYISKAGQLHVVDAQLKRETIYDGSLEMVRTAPLSIGFVHQVAVSPDGALYYNAEGNRPETMGLPLHLMREGQVIHSFGADVPVARPDAPERTQRAMTADSSGIWTARRTHYWLERWTSEGAKTATWDRDVEWFRPYLRREIPITLENPPKPWLMALQAIDDGLIVAAIHVAAEDLAEKLRVRERRPDRIVYDVDDCSEWGDTVLEVLDVENGRVISSSRHDECIVGFVDDELMYGYRLDELGIPRVDVYRPRFPRSGHDN